ncbi:MAG: hypothetical protein JJT94_14395 [Bernardetiaceae bacterium]|nr:hypothetical protein [Bernardetiaceae bacterium]
MRFLTLYVLLFFSACLYPDAISLLAPLTPKLQPYASLQAQVYAKLGGQGFDAANTIIQSKDGNFILAGRSNSYGTGDMNMNVIKVDKTGKTVWDKNYGGDESEEAYAVAEVADGGYIIVGYSDSYGAGPDMKDIWVVKISDSGLREWDKVLGSRESIDEGQGIVADDEGNFLVVGTTLPISGGNSDILAIKIDGKGNVLWEKKYGSKASEAAHGVCKTQNGFAIIGHSESDGRGKWDMFVVSIDNEGNKIWEKSYGGADNEMGNAIKEDAEGNLILAGYTYTFAEGSHDAWVVKVNKEGKQLWTRNYGGLSTDEAFGIAIEDKGNIVMVGYKDIYEPDEYGNNVSKKSNQVLLVKIAPNGTKIWEKDFGGDRMQVGRGVVIGADGSYYIGGYTDENFDNKNMDMLFMKVSPDGKL